MTKRVTIIDLAKAANVSISTVDRILNKRGSVQRATAEHILAVAQHIGFQGLPNLRRRLSEDAPERTFGFLLNRRDRFLYENFARSIIEATTNSTQVRVRAIIRHLDDLSPISTAEALLDLAKECDCIAGVCIDHSEVNSAIRDLSLRGVPFWALLSDVSCEQRAGYVGADCWKLGRSAGWYMSLLCPDGGTIAVLIGSELYQGQGQFEAGFRSYLVEQGKSYHILPTEQTLENDQRAYELTVGLLGGKHEISGLFMGGGGIDGVIQARHSQPNAKLAIVSTEISDMTRQHLAQNWINVALSHEFDQVATTIARIMEMQSIGQSTKSPDIRNINMKVAIRESS